MVKDIIIDGTPNTPTVRLISTEGIIELIGRSIPENPYNFYSPVKKWLDEYSLSPNKLTIVNVKLEYFNTSSSKLLLTFFKTLEDMNNNGSKIEINWYFEENDEDMQEAGEDYNAIIKIPFNIIKVTSF